MNTKTIQVKLLPRKTTAPIELNHLARKTTTPISAYSAQVQARRLRAAGYTGQPLPSANCHSESIASKFLSCVLFGSAFKSCQVMPSYKLGLGKMLGNS